MPTFLLAILFIKWFSFDLSIFPISGTGNLSDKDGFDFHLAAVLRDFQPGPSRRAGVLLDHLVTGSKESQLAAAAVTPDMADFVRITGHPFIDIWQAVKPERLGMAAWPEIPYGTDWKVGICKHLGLPHAEQADIADAFARILSRVRDYRDLDPRLVGPVEMLIDFVTA